MHSWLHHAMEHTFPEWPKSGSKNSRKEIWVSREDVTETYAHFVKPGKMARKPDGNAMFHQQDTGHHDIAL